MKMTPEPILDAIVNRGVAQLPELPRIDGAAHAFQESIDWKTI